MDFDRLDTVAVQQKLVFAVAYLVEESPHFVLQSVVLAVMESHHDLPEAVKMLQFD